MEEAIDYLENIEMDEMDEFTEEDLEMDEEEDMDEFFGRRGRSKRRARRKSRRSKIRSKIQDAKQRVAKTHQERKRRAKKNISMLKAMSNPGFFANPNNRKKLRKKVRNMAKELNGATGLLINKKRRCRCRPLASQIRRRRNFDGFNADGGTTSNVKNIWSQYKVPIIIGGAVVFFFFTPYGKKMMGK